MISVPPVGGPSRVLERTESRSISSRFLLQVQTSPLREPSLSSSSLALSRLDQVSQVSGEQLKGSGATPPGAPPEMEPSSGNSGPQKVAPVLLPRRRNNPDNSWTPKKMAATCPIAGLQKAQSVHCLVVQGEDPVGLSSREWGMGDMDVGMLELDPGTWPCLPLHVP